MSKSDEKRFDAALETLLSLAQREGMVIYNGYAGMLEWLGQQADRATAKQKAGAAISLGYHFSSSPAIAALRDALRALLLLQVTRFAMSGGPLKRLKDRASANPTVARATTLNELKELCGRIIVRPGGILVDKRVYYWAGVNRFAHISQTLRAGRDTGVQLLESAYAYVAQGTDPTGHYVRWFGTGDANVVRTNLRHMMDAYRNKAIGIYAEESGEMLKPVFGSAARAFEALSANVIKVNLGAHFFGQTATYSRQIVYDEQQISYMERAMALSEEREQANKGFFRALHDGGIQDVLERELEARKIDLTAQMREQTALLPPPGVGEQISVAGVILHEVSHNAVRTTDVQEAGQVMYGPNFCMWLARTKPARTVENADSYRLFCEQFMV